VVDPVIATSSTPLAPGQSLRGRQGGLRQILFEWRGVRIYSYPAVHYVGLTLGLIAGNYAANVAGMASARVLVAIILLTVPGLLGARLLFIATHWEIYRREPRRIWRRSEGGAAMLGGLVLALAVSSPLLAAMDLSFWAFWDVATFVMLIWLIFGRLGCLLHGCCSGKPSNGPLTLLLPDHRGIWRRRVPTQLLEAGWAALLLLGATALWSQRPLSGALFLSIVVAYSSGRIALQPMREEQERFRGLNVQQVLCAALAALSLVSVLALWLIQDARP
jgi:phosphatidylglycerol---prolipoprotein diacylglyceryl transferase